MLCSTGVPALITALGRAVHAAVCVLDRDGAVLALTEGASSSLPERIRERSGKERSRIVVDDDGHLAIHRLAVSGTLAVASDAALDQSERLLVGHTVSAVDHRACQAVAGCRCRTAAEVGRYDDGAPGRR